MIRTTTCLLALSLLSLSLTDTTRAQPPSGETMGPSAGLPPLTAKTSAAELAAVADLMEKAYAGTQPPEAVRMLIAIARGSKMGPGDGWFGPAQTRYTWEWLAKAHGPAAAKGIPRKAFRGSTDWFTRLDRNKDGRITPDDLDWSDSSPYMQMANLVSGLFRRINVQGDGRLTREEWHAFFQRAADGKDHLSPDDLRDAVLAGFGGGGAFAPGDGPTPEVLIRGLFKGEIGSLNEGPRLNDPAPDFNLKTHDGKQTVRLSDLKGPKPVVLVFGNFTCGPFRRIYPQVDEVCRRYQGEATFVAVYVREAHPTDGWHMESNAKMGVKVAQPTTYEERVGVAGQCHALLKYSMPLLVDEINDPVGNAYSGMPARLYVIDADGKVAYKSGRGPFGFRPGEMEQALVMALLERQLASAKAP
jgi:thiol-disulfide isomerase/thioredoxin